MTRKEQLEKKVNTVFQCESFGYDIGKSDVLDLLIEVEREALQRVDRMLDEVDHTGDVRKWLYSQQKELG